MVTSRHDLHTMTLPAELIDHIAHVAAHAFHDDPATLANLCTVNHAFRRAASCSLFHSPVLDRTNIKSFVRALQSSERLCSLVKGLAFVASSSLSDGPAPYEHEHVDISDLLRCLSLVRDSVEIICIDMACSQFGCGWFTDLHHTSSGHALDTLHLSRLRRLICRCPKGYLPTCTRKLLDLFGLGRSPSLHDLLLYWTGPGLSHQASDNAESLTRTLQSCPNVRMLSIIEARSIITLSDSHDYEDNERSPIMKTERLNIAQEVWIKSTTANGAVYRADVSSSSSSIPVGAQAKSSTVPPASGLSESIARAARRIDRRRNTLRAHMATIDVTSPYLTAAAAAQTSAVNVEGSTHDNELYTARQRASSTTVSKDRGWDALLTVMQHQTRPSMPLPP